MKGLGRLYRWIIVSLVLQMLLLLSIEIFLSVSSGEVRITAHATLGGLPVGREMKVPLAASGIQLSGSGEFAAFLQGQELTVSGPSSAGSHTVPLQEGERVSLYQWLPDRNMLLCAIHAAGGKGDWVKLFSYDAQTQLIREYPAITGLLPGSVVSEVDLSILTNTVYVKVDHGAGRASVYKYDILNNLDFCFETAAPVSMAQLRLEDLLVYEADKRLYVYNGITGMSGRLSPDMDLVLLGIDRQDRLYAGLLDEKGRVGKILSASMARWSSGALETLALSEPVSPEQLWISPSGEAIRVNLSENTIVRLPAGEPDYYDGEFIQLLEGSYAVRKGGSLQMSSMR